MRQLLLSLQQHWRTPSLLQQRLDARLGSEDLRRQNDEKQNGYYAGAEQCAAFYYHCHDQKTVLMNCPSSTFYDAELGNCHPRNVVPSCGGVRPRPASPPTAPTQPPRNVFCLNKRNGYYPTERCGRFYLHCHNGTVVNMECASNLFYDAEVASCHPRDFIPSCGGARPQPNRPPPQGPNQQAVEQTFCVGKVDGDYGVAGCHNFYFHCRNTIATRMLCSQGRFYDPDFKFCQSREFIPHCGGIRPETELEKPTRPPRKIPANNFTCTGKADGHYSIGCSDVYFSCTNQLRYVRFCPEAIGLKFSQVSVRCDYPANVPECGGTWNPPVPQINTNTFVPNPRNPNNVFRPPPSNGRPPVQPQPQNPREVRPPVAHPQQPNGKCYGKRDGLYNDGQCNRAYFSCTTGRSTDSLCQPGEAFDLNHHKCLQRSAIPYCPEYKAPFQPQPSYGK